MDETWVTLGGTNLTETIQLAIDTSAKPDRSNNALVLLSDGEKHEKGLDDIIQAARQAGVFIIAVGVGTEDGDYVPNPDFPAGNRMVDAANGKPIISRLQPDTLRKLATETNGRYIRCRGRRGHPRPCAARSRISMRSKSKAANAACQFEFYQWLTFPAIVFLSAPLISATRWRGNQSPPRPPPPCPLPDHPSARRR
jgi:Ca-activated chloride channel homolog